MGRAPQDPLAMPVGSLSGPGHGQTLAPGLAGLASTLGMLGSVALDATGGRGGKSCGLAISVNDHHALECYLQQYSEDYATLTVVDIFAECWGPCVAAMPTYQDIMVSDIDTDAVNVRFLQVNATQVIRGLARARAPQQQVDAKALERSVSGNVLTPKSTQDSFKTSGPNQLPPGCAPPTLPADELQHTTHDFWEPLLQRQDGKSKPLFLIWYDCRLTERVEGCCTAQLRERIRTVCRTGRTPAFFLAKRTPKLLDQWTSAVGRYAEAQFPIVVEALRAWCCMPPSAPAFLPSELDRLATAMRARPSTEPRRSSDPEESGPHAHSVVHARRVAEWLGGGSVHDALQALLPEFFQRMHKAAEEAAKKEAEAAAAKQQAAEQQLLAASDSDGRAADLPAFQLAASLQTPDVQLRSPGEVREPTMVSSGRTVQDTVPLGNWGTLRAGGPTGESMGVLPKSRSTRLGDLSPPPAAVPAGAIRRDTLRGDDAAAALPPPAPAVPPARQQPQQARSAPAAPPSAPQPAAAQVPPAPGLDTPDMAAPPQLPLRSGTLRGTEGEAEAAAAAAARSAQQQSGKQADPDQSPLSTLMQPVMESRTEVTQGGLLLSTSSDCRQESSRTHPMRLSTATVAASDD